MMKDIALGQFFPGESAIHKMDPRMKIFLVMAYIVLIFLLQSFVSYGVVLLFLLMITLISKVPVVYMLKSLRPLVFILIFTFVLNLFFISGEKILLEWSFIRITEEGLFQALRLALRLVLLVLGTSLLTLTTSPIALTDGMESMMKPLTVFRFPAHDLAMMMTIALRFIPTLMEEVDKITKAQMARGADFESGNLLKRAKSLIPLLVPLFVSAFRRADDLALAMEARCYRGGVNRTRMNALRYAWRDLMAFIIFAAFFTGSLMLSLSGWIA